jgi:hypothetical protein
VGFWGFGVLGFWSLGFGGGLEPGGFGAAPNPRWLAAFVGCWLLVKAAPNPRWLAAFVGLFVGGGGQKGSTFMF